MRKGNVFTCLLEAVLIDFRVRQLRLYKKVFDFPHAVYENAAEFVSQ